jgi:hypothetical protein
MSGIERVVIAVAIGLVQAVIVWTVSTVYRLPSVWPGTILVFAMGVPTVLLLLRTGGRR